VPVHPLSRYRADIGKAVARGDDTEHTHRPALKALVEALVSGVTATNEPKRVDCGAPDYCVSLNTPHGPLTIGHIETKDVGSNLESIERDSRKASPAKGSDGEQLKRYRRGLINLILTDYLEFRWYVDGERRAIARLGTLDPKRTVTLAKGGPEAVEALLRDFLAHKVQPISKPKELAERLARLTHLVRDIVVQAFEAKTASGTLRGLREAFAEVLIPDLSIGAFADMFSQTIAYGLFAGRLNHAGPPPFRRQDAAALIPKSNPFLRRLFATMAGPDLDDEPFVGFVDDLAQLLADTDTGAVLAEFGKRTKREDPIVHFYETFLAAYDPQLRKSRGVYYTPEPVVSYIVRSVDHLLRTRFDCPNGLADSSTVTYRRIGEDGNELTETVPRVLVLDPACGTGTFLYAVVDLIREQFMRQGNAGKWPPYVRENLLKRLFGFELLMAPYAVAHLKLGMQLAGQDLPEAQRADWGCDLAGDDRLGVYLTNTLEKALKKSELLMGGWISDEANAAAEIKRDLPIMVVLGNPPYANFGSMNKGKWIRALLADYKKGLHEKKLNLDDDYIKFVRFAQWRIEQTGSGILAFITNHSYLDGLTHRRMRESLMGTFDEIYVLDLHGNKVRKEKCPDGSEDKNVFDIKQGVAIAIFVRQQGLTGPADVRHAELWGTREAKYSRLLETDVSSTDWTELKPKLPSNYFVPSGSSYETEYKTGISLADIFRLHQNGLKTDRDDLFFDCDRDTLAKRMNTFYSPLGITSPFKEQYNIRDSSSYDLIARRAATSFDAGNIRRCLYRPFDGRWLYYFPSLTSRPAWEVMRNMLAGPNRGIITTRQTRDEFGALATSSLCGHKSLAAFDINTLFPLYVYPAGEGQPNTQADMIGLSPWPEGKDGRRPNLEQGFVDQMVGRTGLAFVPDGEGDVEETFGPDDVFHYIYAVLHSPTYRARYAVFLKTDFPRIPLTSDPHVFQALVGKGRKLVGLHLLASPALAKAITSYPVPGSNIVDPGFPRYVPQGEPSPESGEPVDASRVYINQGDPKAGQYFAGVAKEVWEFWVGGYQPCKRWLKDRRGRALSSEDIELYEKLVVAINETIRVMAEIDAAIPKWPVQ
jgi:hypothetical protein